MSKKIAEFFIDNFDELVHKTHERFAERELKSYLQLEDKELKSRIRKFCIAVFQSLQHDNILPVIKYAQEFSSDRIRQGYRLEDIQMAMNCTEESMMSLIAAKVEGEASLKYIENVGMIMRIAHNAVSKVFRENTRVRKGGESDF